MKQHLIELFSEALARLAAQDKIPPQDVEVIRFDRTRQPSHGDLATNLALVLAKPAGRNPRELAAEIVAALPASTQISKVEIAGPGFINVFLATAAQFAVVREVLEAADRFGHGQAGRGQRVLIEFVSANPTGPLHVGHGRGAAYGDALARVMAAAGYQVDKEYYVNDAGRQMDILALSVWLRYLELCGEAVEFPDNCYQGDYIYDIAADVHRGHGDALRRGAAELAAVIAGLDPEPALDALIQQTRQILGPHYQIVFDAALDTLVSDIRTDLAQLNVVFDHWFSERSLYSANGVDRAIALLRQYGHVFEQQGALWFRSSRFGDEKDRVLVRENGTPTYFAGDIAYHLHKYERGYDRMIDIWGADHHGYVARVKGAVSALQHDPERLHVALVQFAVLYRGREKVSMSTRSGEFVTLRELRQEVGADAARFFYVQRKSDQHMDFDLELAKSQSNDNPVYYVQYAHARVCSVFKQAQDRDITTDGLAEADLGLLTEAHETELAGQLARFPEVVSAAAVSLEPHQLAYFLRDLANGLHTYYNAHQFLSVAPELRRARLALVAATRQVIANGLALLGVSAPEQM